MTVKDVAMWLGIASSIAAAGASFAVTQERVRVLRADYDDLAGRVESLETTGVDAATVGELSKTLRALRCVIEVEVLHSPGIDCRRGG